MDWMQVAGGSRALLCFSAVLLRWPGQFVSHGWAVASPLLENATSGLGWPSADVIPPMVAHSSGETVLPASIPLRWAIFQGCARVCSIIYKLRANQW
jgi:hypothetical protein